jgi:hypothetical protein
MTSLDQTVHEERAAGIHPAAREILDRYEAWLIGSGTDYLLGLISLDDVGDWDVIVHPNDWNSFTEDLDEGALLLGFESLNHINRHEGYTFGYKGVMIDVWPHDVHTYLTQEYWNGASAERPRKAINLTHGLICQPYR